MRESNLMNFFSKNRVRIGDKPAAEYMVCVPVATVKEQLSLQGSELNRYLKMYLPKGEMGKNFEAEAAAILGAIICREDFAIRFRQEFRSCKPETVLLNEPEDLEQPTLSMTQNVYPLVRLWLRQSWVERQPAYC